MLAEVKSRKAFTLIELLVVISIIAVLMAVLIPVLSRSREQGKRILCSSFLKQLTVASNAYSLSFENKLPSFTAPSGPHVHDISGVFIDYMTKNYSLERKHFFCPSIPNWRKEMCLENTLYTSDTHLPIGYNVWIPRRVEVYGIDIPPKESIGTFVVKDKRYCQAAQKNIDLSCNKVPIITDQVSTKNISPDGKRCWSR